MAIWECHFVNNRFSWRIARGKVMRIRKIEQETQVQGETQEPLPALREIQGLLPEVRHVQALFSQLGAQG